MSGDDWKGDGGRRRKLTFEQELQLMLQAEPFRPFTFVMASGQEVEATAPEAVSIGDVFINVVLYRRGEARLRTSAIVMIRIQDND